MQYFYSATEEAGRWTLRHESQDTGPVEVNATTRDAALGRLRSEIRYRLEMCPCTGEIYQDAEIELVERM